MENQIKNKKIFWLGVSLVVIILLTVTLFVFMFRDINKQREVSSQNYTVLGVPYMGVYNHNGSVINIDKDGGGDSCSAVLEILEYWNPGQNNLSVACDTFRSKGTQKNDPVISSDDFVNFFSDENFSAEKLTLSISDLKKYINPEVKTPLVLFLPLAINQPDNMSYRPATVLIGVNEKEQYLTFHSFWLGNNYEISFDEFNQLQNSLSDNQKNSYIVIQPRNLDEKLKEIAQRKTESYSDRTSIMQNGVDMFKNYALGSNVAYRISLWPQSLEYLSKVEDSSNFNEFFPPYFKTILYSQKSKIYLLKDDLNNALTYAQKAVAENHDLDKPFKDWPGYEAYYTRPDKRNATPEAYIALGDILDKRGDLEGSLIAYKKASSLMINSAQVDASIRNVELEIAKKGIVE